MRELTALDSSILALIAENPGMSPQDFKELRDRAKSPFAKEVAEEIVNLSNDGVGQAEHLEARKTAKALLDWAKTNRAFLRHRRAASAD
jgi:hypothetical protein